MPTLSRIPGGWLNSLLPLFRKTIFHPQWITLRHQTEILQHICSNLCGTVADIGCAEGKPRQYLKSGTGYIGIDYYTTSREWYRTRPDVFADAQALPLAPCSLDHALLLDVLEHLPDPDRCLMDIYRTLKPGGSLTLLLPFHYPIHDAPLDFHRWTRFGLREAASRCGFQVKEELALGHPLESAALNMNIALSKTVLNWICRKNILAISMIFLPVLIPTINLLSWAGARLSSEDNMMPYGYHMVWTKQS
ncbi:MAG: class I SAM-dependent methyltransferase [bacterium]